MVVSALQYMFGRGVGYLVAFLISFSTLIASASRAGTLATLAGLSAMLALGILITNRGAARQLSVAMAAVLGVLVFGLIGLSGNTLAFRLQGLVDAGGVDAARLALWGAARRMISDAPLLGLGLGTFPDAYPLYASQVLPFVMDKAHNDYLEFAAGLGLPAAVAWWAAWTLLVFDCARGVFRRRRNRQFVILALGASVLIAVHSAFDFSLQIPAVAFFYATLMGIGLAQARSTQASR
jgi:O-antigen ligase